MKPVRQSQTTRDLANLFIALAVITLGLVGLSHDASAADRVGNGNGRTVELALTKLNEKVPGVDGFHKILYAFENGTPIEGDLVHGIWTGISYQYVRRDSEEGQKVPETVLHFQSEHQWALVKIDMGPVFGSRVAGYDWTPSSSYPDYVEKEWMSQTAQSVSSALMEENDRSLVLYTQRFSYVKRDRAEIRYYKGAVVGVVRPNKQGICENGIFQKTPNVCAVLYYFSRKVMPPVK